MEKVMMRVSVVFSVFQKVINVANRLQHLNRIP
jgi:hypothetical protein